MRCGGSGKIGIVYSTSEANILGTACPGCEDCMLFCSLCKKPLLEGGDNRIIDFCDCFEKGGPRVMRNGKEGE